MKMMMTAIALTIALPAVANAQSAPAPAPKTEQGHKMDCKCCKDMAANGHAGHQMGGGSGGHAGHAMGQQGANAPNAGHQHNAQQ